MLDYYVLTGLINAITSTFLGLFVYFTNPKSTLNKTFALFCAAVAIWSWAYCFWPNAQDKDTALFWFQVLHIGAILVPVFYFHFVLIFLNFYQEKKRILQFGYFIAFIFLLFVFTPLFISDMVPRLLFSYWAVPGVLYHFFLLMFFSYTAYSWYLMLRALLKSTGIKRLQIKYVLVGTFIGFLGGSTNYPLWYNIPIPPVGNGLVAIYVILVAYAILKHHLMNIRVILTELLVGAIGLIILIQIFSAPSLSWQISNIIIFILFCIFGYYLIKATHEESKRREEAERLAKEAQNLALTKDQFLLSIQHHLRTPLTPIIGYVEGILSGAYGKIENSLVKEKLISIQKSADVLHNLMERLLDIQSLRVGKRVLNLEDCRYEDLVEEVIQEVKPEAESKKLPIKFTKTSLPQIKLDKKRIREVIWNLLDNAIKYTEKGRIEVNLSQIKKEGKDSALLFVSDTGIGVTQEEQEEFLRGKLFERGQMAKKLYGPGRGIGLAISLEFIRAHNGRLWIESQGRGKGSTFYVELPILI